MPQLKIIQGGIILKNSLGKRKTFISVVLAIVIVKAAQVFAAGVIESITATIRRNTLFVNSNAVNMPVLFYEGTSYVPVRFISETFGADVNFDPATNNINIVNDIMKSEISKLDNALEKDTINALNSAYE